jgi:hypothetical protein
MTFTFFGIMAYNISQSWEHQEVLIGFKPRSGSNTGQSLTVILAEHGLTLHLLAITTDYASNNDIM